MTSGVAAQPTPCTDCDQPVASGHASTAGRCSNCERRHKQGKFCKECDRVCLHIPWRRAHRIVPGLCHPSHLVPGNRNNGITRHQHLWLLLLQVWFDSDQNMVECDGCEFWIHDTCDMQAKQALKAAARGGGDEVRAAHQPGCCIALGHTKTVDVTSLQAPHGVKTDGVSATTGKNLKPVAACRWCTSVPSAARWTRHARSCGGWRRWEQRLRGAQQVLSTLPRDAYTVFATEVHRCVRSKFLLCASTVPGCLRSRAASSRHSCWAQNKLQATASARCVWLV